MNVVAVVVALNVKVFLIFYVGVIYFVVVVVVVATILFAIVVVVVVVATIFMFVALKTHTLYIIFCMLHTKFILISYCNCCC